MPRPTDDSTPFNPDLSAVLDWLEAASQAIADNDTDRATSAIARAIRIIERLAGLE